MKHYSKEELDMFRNKELSLLGQIICSAHLRECRQCMNMLRELEEEDRLLDELRNSIRTFREISGTSTKPES